MITELERRLMDAFHEDAQRARLVNPDQPAMYIGHGEDAPNRRDRSRQWMRVAAATIAVLGLGLLAVTVLQDPDGAQTDTVPPPPPPATNPATTPSVPPVDSAQATLPPNTASAPTVPSVILDTTTPSPLTEGPSLWVELAPGATAPLPPAPIANIGAALVWTGAELIVWGGIADFRSSEGAAFDPAAGTWRQIAPPPDGVRPGVVLWTGIEMLVWGDGTANATSAAYDPANDTWRLIADPPDEIRPGAALWIGDGAVLLRDPDADNDGYVDAVSSPSFAYDPATDEWRRLADGPWGQPVLWVSGRSTSALWTGTTIITMTDTDSDAGILLNAYDPATDTWRALEGVDTVVQPVVIPGRGDAANVALLPLEPDTPVELLDDRGNAIGELAGRPAELASTCYQPVQDNGCLLTSLRAVSVGAEVLFWYSDNGWAFDPEEQTWRSLPLDGRQPGWDGTEVVAAGDLLFAWSADRDGLVYRAARPG